MRETFCQSWREFEEALQQITTERDTLKRGTIMRVSNFLFRGQYNSSWRLETTLERYAPHSMEAADYYRRIHGAKYHIESLTGLSWNILRPDKYSEWLAKEHSFGLFDLPGDEYMIHLRHHGFPSPLLDWSRSPYIAAFFAFRHPSPSATHVSIYAFMEYAGHAKTGYLSSPHIIGRGPYVRSHRRHFLQQCQYTICTVRYGEEWRYACHEDAVVEESEHQDFLWKFNIPVTEREPVLRRLDHYNLNAYSLFGSDESLMESVAFREFFDTR